MHDTQLHLGVGKYSLNRFGKTFKSIDTGNDNIVNATIFKFRYDIEPELGPFAIGDPQAQQLFVAIEINTQVINDNYYSQSTTIKSPVSFSS